ncbi:MAG: hypothetical protein GXP09_10995 [Gammaproteobacteria bacterium]|nr:hypothetical protein [Gammaproteobacteria bacterium]
MIKICIGVVLVLLGTPVWATETGSKFVISKCQDIDGKWHYGDRAADECAQSKVTELDEQGYKRKEIAVPKTGKELEVEKAAIKKEESKRRAKKEQREVDQRTLAIYELEVNLIRARDEKLAHIDTTIQANNNFIGKLRIQVESLGKQLKESQQKNQQADIQKRLGAVQAQILAYERDNIDRKVDRKRVEEKYALELDRFRHAAARRDGLEFKPGEPKETTPEPIKTETAKVKAALPDAKDPDKTSLQGGGTQP